ncbi:MAG: DrmE family protein [Bacillota bacterium]|nr:hypothetical protein [Bacillota bacterium]
MHKERRWIKITPDICQDLSFVQDLDLRYGSEPYSLTDYDIHNIIAVYDSLIRGTGDQAILGPTGFATMLLSSIVIAICLIHRSLKSQSEAMYKVLKKGDIVRLDGKRGQFIGVDPFEGSIDTRPKIKIGFRGGLVVGLDLDQAWRLTKCAAGVSRIDRFDKKVPQTTSPHYILKEILGFKRNQIPPALKVKLPVVATKRESLLHYSNIFVGDQPCPTILPAGYYSRENHFERIGEDPLQREPVICFASEMEVAAGIANKHQGTAGIIVLDYSKLRGNLSRITDLQANNKRTVLISDISTIDKDDIGNLESLGFNITAWTPSTVRAANVKRISQHVSSAESVSNPFTRANCVLHNVAYGTSERLLVNSLEGETINAIGGKLRSISRQLSQTDAVSRFIMICYELLMQLRCLPLSLKQLNALGHSPQYLLDRLDELSVLDLYHVVPSAILPALLEIKEGLHHCMESHGNNHPKHAIFCESIRKLGVNDCLLVRNRREQRVLLDWFSKHADLDVLPFKVLTLTEALANRDPVEKCLTLGWYGRRYLKLRHSGFCAKETLIVYPFESEQKDIVVDKMSSYLRRISRGSSLSSGIARIDSGWPDLEECINRFAAQWEEHMFKGQPHMPTDQSLVHAVPVEFEEDYVAFITLGHNCRCLDEEEERIIAKKANELRPGDLLVFVKDSSDDIFDKLTELVKGSNPDIRKLTDLTNLWKDALSRYIQVHGLSLREFQQMLSNEGVKRTIPAIRAWLKEDCIGSEDEAIVAIALITQDRELNDKLDEVIAACTQIRSLHIRLGRYLARAIVASTTGGLLSEEEPLLQKVTNDLSSHAEVVSVRRIAATTASVPLNRANRLINKFLDI